MVLVPGVGSNKKGRCLFCDELVFCRPAQIRNHHRVEGKPHVKECVPKHNLGEYPLFKAELVRRAAVADAAADVRRADTVTAAIVATNHQAAIVQAGSTSRAADALPTHVTGLQSFKLMDKVDPKMVNVALTAAVCRNGLSPSVVDSKAFRLPLTLAAMCGSDYLVYDDAGKVLDCKAPHRDTLTKVYIPALDDGIDGEVSARIMTAALTTGGVLISDAATDVTSKPIVNGLFATAEGTRFLEARNVEGHPKTKEAIAELMIEWIILVGPENVTAICMDGACRQSFPIIKARFPWIMCYICPTHSFNNGIGDVFKEEQTKHISKPDGEGGYLDVEADTSKFCTALKKGKEIVKLVTSHSEPLAIYRKVATNASKGEKEGGTELLKQAMTRFGSAVKVIERLVHVRPLLARTVASQEFIAWHSKQGRDAKNTTTDIINYLKDDELFNDLDTCRRVLTPHYKAMRWSDGKAGSHLGIIYALCLEIDANLSQRGAIKGLTEEERNGLHKLWMPRWEYFHVPLMSAAYAFSKAYLRNDLQQNVRDDLQQVWAQLEQHPHAKREGWTKVQFEAEFDDFKRAILLRDHGLNANGAFSSYALRMRDDLWYGQFAQRWPTVLWSGPRLTTCTPSASACETLWGHMEWIHSKKRNRMSHTLCERLLRAHANLVYVEHATDPWWTTDWEVDMLIEEPEEQPADEEEDDELLDLTGNTNTPAAEDTEATATAGVATVEAANEPRRSGRAKQTPGGLGGMIGLFEAHLARGGRLPQPAGRPAAH